MNIICITCPICNVNKFFVYKNRLYKCTSCRSFSKEYLIDNFFGIKSKEDDIDYNPGYYNEIIKMKNNFNNQENQRIRLYEPDGEEVGADYGYLEDYDD